MRWTHGSARRFCLAILCAGVLAAVAAPRPAIATDIQLQGLLDLVVSERGDAIPLNLLWRDNQYDSYRFRFFATAAVSDRLDIFTELLANEDVGVVPFGAYATFHPSPGRDLNLEIGLIPWPIGDWAPRANSDKNPLIGIPTMYHYHTSLVQGVVVPSTDALIAAAGQGSYGVSYAGWPGMPIIYDQWWDFGAAFLGSARPFEFAVGFVNGSPGFPNPGVDHTPGKSVMGRLGLAPMPSLRFGVSGSYGPYLDDGVEGSLSPGQKVGDFNQVLAMADVELSTGHAEFHAEGFSNMWETPTVGDLGVKGGYAELKYALPAGFYVAGRYDVMRFDDVVDSTGTALSWDADVDRLEVGAGYRVTKGVIAKVTYQRNELQPPDPALEAEVLDVFGGQLSVAF